ncbi:MAG: tetratricopeptide repeat protein [Bacteroidota bacterium]
MKLFLSVLTLFWVVMGCNDTAENLPSEEAKEQSRQLFETAFHTDKRHPLQGSRTAMNLLDSILNLDTTNAAAWREKSVPYLKRGLPYEWKPLFDKAVQYHPEVWQPWRGYLYLMFYRDYEKAIADFNASDTLTPQIDYPQGHSVDYWRGIAYLGLKDFKNSIAYFNKHIKKETEDTGEDWVELEAFLYRGIAYYEIGNCREAITNFDKIKQHFISSAEGKYYWAKCLFHLGKTDEALSMLNEAESDYKNQLCLDHDYVEMPYQIYLTDITDLKSSLLP